MVTKVGKTFFPGRKPRPEVRIVSRTPAPPIFPGAVSFAGRFGQPVGISATPENIARFLAGQRAKFDTIQAQQQQPIVSPTAEAFGQETITGLMPEPKLEVVQPTPSAIVEFMTPEQREAQALAIRKRTQLGPEEFISGQFQPETLRAKLPPGAAEFVQFGSASFGVFRSLVTDPLGSFGFTRTIPIEQLGEATRKAGIGVLKEPAAFAGTLAGSALLFGAIGKAGGRVSPPKVTRVPVPKTTTLRDALGLGPSERGVVKLATVSKRTGKGAVGIAEADLLFGPTKLDPIPGRLVSKFISGTTKKGKLVSLVETEADVMTKLGRIDRKIRTVLEGEPISKKVTQTRFAAVSESFERLQTTLLGKRIGERVISVGRGTTRELTSLSEAVTVRLAGKITGRRRIVTTKELVRIEAERGDLLFTASLFQRGAFKVQAVKDALRKAGLLQKGQKQIFQLDDLAARERLSLQLPFLDLRTPTGLPQFAKTLRTQRLKTVQTQRRQVKLAEDNIKNQINLLEKEFGITKKSGIPPITAPRRPVVPIPAAQLGVEQAGLVGLIEGNIAAVRDLTEFEIAQNKASNEAFVQAFGKGLKQDQQAVMDQRPKNIQPVETAMLNEMKQNELSISKQMQSQASAQKQSQKQAQQQVTAMQTLMAQQITTPTVQEGLFQLGVPRGPRVPRWFGGLLLPITDGRQPGKGRKLKAPGWNAVVKRRGKIVKLTPNPVTRSTALSVGGQFVDRGPAASFEIRKTKKNARGPEVDTFGQRKFKFRQRRTKQALLLVEKRRYRIDSPGEVAGISLQGNFAQLDRSMLGDMREDMPIFNVPKTNKNRQLNLLEVM